MTSKYLYVVSWSLELMERVYRVEAQLSQVLAPDPPTLELEIQSDCPPAALGSIILSKFDHLTSKDVEKKENRIEKTSWTALGGYCLAASIGIGVSPISVALL